MPWLCAFATIGPGGKRCGSVQPWPLYANGQGVSQDYAQAASWYRSRRARYSSPSTTFGLCTQMAKACRKTMPAASWYRSRRADTPMRRTAPCLIQQSARCAATIPRQWFASKGCCSATPPQYNLGLMYGNGHVPRDYVQTYKWYDLAASRYKASERKCVIGQSKIATAPPRMTPSQIAEAQSLHASGSCRPNRRRVRQPPTVSGKERTTGDM